MTSVQIYTVLVFYYIFVYGLMINEGIQGLIVKFILKGLPVGYLAFSAINVVDLRISLFMDAIADVLMIFDYTFTISVVLFFIAHIIRIDILKKALYPQFTPWHRWLILYLLTIPLSNYPVDHVIWGYVALQACMLYELWTAHKEFLNRGNLVKSSTDTLSSYMIYKIHLHEKIKLIIIGYILFIISDLLVLVESTIVKHSSLFTYVLFVNGMYWFAQYLIFSGFQALSYSISS